MTDRLPTELQDILKSLQNDRDVIEQKKIQIFDIDDEYRKYLRWINSSID